MAITNSASWIEQCEGDFVVKESAFHKPGRNEVLVKNAAVALNPLDWKLKAFGKHFPFPTTYPFIFGCDIAGDIYEVGQDVTAFKKGDRVIGGSNWLASMQTKHSGFQKYTVCSSAVISHLPDDISFASGSVLPLAICTSAMGLYPAGRLGLPFPQATNPKPANQVLLVWGGSSSCGSVAIQLAVASGVTVISTASAGNHAFVKSLGATAVVDYHSSIIAQDLVDVAKQIPGDFVGALDAIGQDDTWRACADITQTLGGGRVVTNLPAPVFTDVPEGVEVSGVTDTANIADHPDIVDGIWGKFVPEALKNGALKPAPEPVVVGKGLEKIAEAVALGLKGVSAAKLVIEL